MKIACCIEFEVAVPGGVDSIAVDRWMGAFATGLRVAASESGPIVEEGVVIKDARVLWFRSLDGELHRNELPQ
jgi:hypothetical protein